jgi:AcrR family transcriptional regulator
VTKRAMKPRKLPRQQRSRVTVEAILEAAAQVFVARGYAGGTTNHVAERAGVSIGSLYQYFPNKDALLVALMERHVEESGAELRRLALEASTQRWPLEETLRRFVAATIAFHTEAPDLHRVLFEEAPHPPELFERLRRVEAAMTALAARIFSDTLGLTDTRAQHTAWVVVHTVEALVHQWVIHPPTPRISEEKIVEEVVAMLGLYLRNTTTESSF